MILATQAAALAPLVLPQRYNYVAAFLTFACNLRCSYCINRFDSRSPRGRTIPGRQWVQGLNRLESRPDLPVTLQGGEPSLHPDFFDIIEGLRPDMPIDILTNLQFDIEAFMARIPPERVKREAPYASIRVSYHPETMDLAALKDKTLRLLANGYSVGIWAVEHPAWREQVRRAQEICVEAGVDFRLKEFLGFHEGRLHGTYRYPGALSLHSGPPVRCRTSELIVGPDGQVYRCHGDLYAGAAPIGRLADPEFDVRDEFRACDRFGFCNPCDVKVKTNRFQQHGHTSVDIRPA